MSKSTIKIIANSITTSRLIFALILICLINCVSNYTFLIIMAVLYSTDFVDGFLARKYHVQTFYGSIMDTLADKTLNIALILPLIKEIPLMLAVLIFEIIIMLINIIGKIKGKQVRTKYLGKIKMWVVALAIGLGYLSIFNILDNLNMFIPITITSLFQITSIIDYIVYLKKQKNTKKYFSFKNKEEFIYEMFDTEYYLKNN